MDYVYADDDNAAMTDERWEAERNRTDERWQEEQSERRDRQDQKKRDALDGLLDMLCLTGGCRECPNIVELAEGFLGSNGLIANEQIEYLEHVCKTCGGKGTGVVPEEAQEWIDYEWEDRLYWARANLPRYSCAWCQVAFRIYGQYKDPDDEWKAIDSADGCANCKYFQEAE